jgi:hypothetical protein
MVNAKFTQKVEQYLATAAELAQESSHQQLSPVHLAIAMFEDPEGIGKQSAVKAGGKASAAASTATDMRMLMLSAICWLSTDSVHRHGTCNTTARPHRHSCAFVGCASALASC